MDDINSNPSKRSFDFKNDLCYTEDHIVVQELYLYAIPTELKEEELLEYFNSYGKVRHLHLYANDGCCPGQTDSDSSGRLKSHQQEKEVKTGRVLFVNPLDAAKVLLNKIHHVNGRQFQVTVAHSWLQPEGNDILEPPSSQPEQSHVMKVPDDCLVRILELLPLTDQLRFLRYCSRFRDILHLDTRTLHKSVVIDNFKSLSEWDIRDLFIISGRSIQSIEYNSFQLKIDFGRFLNYFETNCVNLKSLTVRRTKITPKNLFKMIDNLDDLEIIDCILNKDSLASLKNIKKLKKLCICCCEQLNGNVGNVQCQLNDRSLTILKDLKHLKTLNLSKNPDLLGELQLPSTIETLCLSECKNVTPNNLIQMCKSLPNLKELDIRSIRNVPSDIYDYLNSIETFTFDIERNTEYRKIARLPNLKRIQIEYIHAGNALENLLAELAAIKSQQIEHFEISELMDVRKPTLLQMAKLTGLRKLYLYSDAMDNNVLEEFTKLKKLESLCSIPFDVFNDTGILRLINGCPKLRHLSLNNCSELTESLVLAIIDNVRRQIMNKENQRELPIYLFVQDTKIRKSIEAHPDVAAKNIIKLVFDCYCDCFFG
ncbi:F-box/LRR-repeat protein 2-like [Drosophila tropicalis]|uniref:F-box/LRR-repeat protein 2-like n=1 Tax=Drosophila tropicalis TaxID=46794 RepID=UPI0035ABEE22